MDSKNKKIKKSRSGRQNRRPSAHHNAVRKSAVSRDPRNGALQPQVRRTSSGAAYTDDAGVRRMNASERSRKTRERQNEEDRVRRFRRRKSKQSEIQPFKFSDVKQKKRIYSRNDGHTAEIIYKSLLTAAILAIIIFVFSVFFEVRTIRCEGTSKYSSMEIINRSGIEIGDKMLMLKRHEAAENIISALPYIKTVSIRQHYPTSVNILVKERIPIAKVGSGVISHIIDEDGYLLESTVLDSGFDVLQVICPMPVDPVPGKQLVFDDPLMLETLQTVLLHIAGSQWADNIDVINIEKIYSVSFTYQGRLQVKIGDASNLDMKLKLLAEVIKKNSEDAVGVIDVTNTDHVSFQPGH